MTLQASDGFLLRGELLLPSPLLYPDGPTVAVVLSHAMMVDRRTLDQPRGSGLLSELLRVGAAVLWMDLRGHGQSGPTVEHGGRWDYDMLVRDTGLFARFLMQRFPELPRFAIGHSLFGHVALAWQTGVLDEEISQPGGVPVPESAPAPRPERFDGLVLLACNVWLPELEPLWWRWAVKRATVAALLMSRRLAPLRDYVPVRRLGLGTADEPAAYFSQMVDWTRHGDWTDRRGRSFRAALGGITVPILSVASDGDRLLSVPACQLRMASALGGPVTHWNVGKRHGDPCDPTHMSLVLDRRLRSVWHAVAAWVVETAAAQSRAAAGTGPAETPDAAEVRPKPDASSPQPASGSSPS